MRLAFIFPALLLLLIASCNKPGAHNNTSFYTDEPLISSVSLADTLSAKYCQVISPVEKEGIKLEYFPGQFSAYFDYEADHSTVLKAISKLPFTPQSLMADVGCRQIDSAAVLTPPKDLSPQALESAWFFYENNPADFDAYECLKPPYRHTMLLNKHSKQVLHRVDVI